MFGFRKPDFWPMCRLRLLIFHTVYKFGAKMLIDAEIMAENQNPRWRPPAILELMHHHTGPPTKSIHWAVKFYANPMHSFEDMAI